MVHGYVALGADARDGGDFRVNAGTGAVVVSGSSVSLPSRSSSGTGAVGFPMVAGGGGLSLCASRTSSIPSMTPIRVTQGRRVGCIPSDDRPTSKYKSTRH